jgi:hypothetical protein
MSKQIGVLHVTVTVLAAAAFVVSWSSGFLVPAIAADSVDAVSPLGLLVWRFVPLALILVIIVVSTGAARGVTRADVGRQALIGLFAQFGYCAAVYAAIGAGVAIGTTALIDAVQPLIVAVLVGPLLGCASGARSGSGSSSGRGECCWSCDRSSTDPRRTRSRMSGRHWRWRA